MNYFTGNSQLKILIENDHGTKYLVRKKNQIKLNLSLNYFIYLLFIGTSLFK